MAREHPLTDRIHDTAELPDNPRDCCRAAIKLMIGSDFEDSLTEAGDAVEIACSAGELLRHHPHRGASAQLERAGRAMKRLHDGIDTVQGLVRHGSGDHREFDKRDAGTVAATRPDAA